jgi:hypothetical protein
VFFGLLGRGLTALIAPWRSRIRPRAEPYAAERERPVPPRGDRVPTEKAPTENRVERQAIRPLSDAERVRFAQLWRKALARYTLVAAVAEADQILTEAMQLSGFPIADLEQCSANLSLDHPRLAENYYAAHELARMSSRGRATTADLRQALDLYRVLFEELVEVPPPELAAAR